MESDTYSIFVPNVIQVISYEASRVGGKCCYYICVILTDLWFNCLFKFQCCTMTRFTFFCAESVLFYFPSCFVFSLLFSDNSISFLFECPGCGIDPIQLFRKIGFLYLKTKVTSDTFFIRR